MSFLPYKTMPVLRAETLLFVFALFFSPCLLGQSCLLTARNPSNNIQPVPFTGGPVYFGGMINEGTDYCSINLPSSNGFFSPIVTPINIGPSGGENIARFQVSVNPSTGQRTATIAVANLTFTLIQAGNPNGVPILNVPPLYQRTSLPDGTTDLTKSPWGNDIYDNTTKTIGAKGCALTALNMALNYADPNLGLNSSNLDPGLLNKFVEALRDYSDDGGVQMDRIVRDISKEKLKLNTSVGTSPIAGSPSVNDLDLVLQKGFPIIVGVGISHLENGRLLPSHYVLVTGRQKDGDYQIIDPGHVRNTSLSTAYSNDFTIRGYVADPPGDISALNITIGNDAEMLVTDPLRRRLGTLPKVIYNEIPQGSYILDSLSDDITGDAATTVNHSLNIFQPVQGSYALVLMGVAKGPYKLISEGYTQTGASIGAVTISGATAEGFSSSFKIQFASGAQPVLTVAQVFGDLNGDMKVDCSDLSIVKSGFGTSTGQPGFDARADVNFDGVINIRDLAFVSQRLPVGTICR